MNNLTEQIGELEKTIFLLERDKFEIENMKTGSIAKIEQITAISKMRIILPKRRLISYPVSVFQRTQCLALIKK